MPRDLAEGWARDPTWKNTTGLVGQGAAHHICKQLPGEHQKAERGFAWGSSLSRAPSNTERAARTTTTVSKDEASARLKNTSPEAAPCQSTVATSSRQGTAGPHPELLHGEEPRRQLLLTPPRCQDIGINASLSRHLITRDSKTGASSKSSSKRN